MYKIRFSVIQSRRVFGAVISVGCLSLLCGAAAAVPATGSPPAPASQPAVTTVAAGPARSLGEPAGAQDSAVGAVVATSFGASGAQVHAWTRASGSAGWSDAGRVLPRGFGSSYDASAAAAPGGPVLVVAGVSPPNENCIGNGSVAIANVRSNGRLSPARLVSDQRGTGSFDDRPAVAVGSGGTVWVAWSQGPDADACQNVGKADHLEVAVSHDGGQTFGVPAALPSGGGDSAFGARLVALPAGRAAVSWTEQFGGGQESVLVSLLSGAGRPSPPRRVLTGAALPLVLPGASFYDFPAGDLAALPGGSLAVAAPLWRSGHAVIGLSEGTPGGRWAVSDVTPPGGADLLLPALADLPDGTLRLLCAVHYRSGDRLGYVQAGLRAGTAPGGKGAAVAAVTGLTPVTPAPAGPGFFEIGEELSITQAPGGPLAAVIVAGGSGARLETLAWPLPAPGKPDASRPAASQPAVRHTTGPAGAGPTRSASPVRRQSAAGPTATAVTVWVAIVLAAVAAALGAWRWRRGPLRRGRGPARRGPARG